MFRARWRWGAPGRRTIRSTSPGKAGAVEAGGHGQQVVAGSDAGAALRPTLWASPPLMSLPNSSCSRAACLKQPLPSRLSWKKRLIAPGCGHPPGRGFRSRHGSGRGAGVDDQHRVAQVAQDVIGVHLHVALQLCLPKWQAAGSGMAVSMGLPLDVQACRPPSSTATGCGRASAAYSRAAVNMPPRS